MSDYDDDGVRICEHGARVGYDQLGCSTCDDLRELENAEEDDRVEREAKLRRRLAWRLGDLLERLGRRMKGE